MRLLINAIPLLGEDSGIGNYTRYIAGAALANPTAWDVTFFYGYPSKKLVPLSEHAGHNWLGALKNFARRGSLPRKIAKKALCLANQAANTIRPQTWDCYFEPNFVLLPTITAKTAVITIHDFSCFRYPQWHPADRVAHMQKFFWESVEKASHIITVSETIRREATEMYGIAPERVTAIPNGVDHGFFRPVNAEAVTALKKRYGLPENFILYVGAFEPRKNLLNLLKAHALLPTDLRRRFPLALIGPQGWNNREIMEIIHKEAEFTRLIGHVLLADLPAFYTACALFAYPSWYEGFGLPVLEAMACGRAVLASDTPALMELCGGSARHAPPDDVEAIAQTMRELLENECLRHSLGQKAMGQAQKFSWEQSAKEHLRLFAQVVSSC